MSHPAFRRMTLASLAALVAYGCHRAGPTQVPPPAISAVASAERGKYVVRVAGCNDCHTPGAQQFGESVPEALWLTGVPVGWRGPWGTTYASNLRLFVKDMDETTWTATMRTRNARPPMPWAALHAMTDTDLTSVYRYLRYLGPAGLAMPEGLPPGLEPKGFYIEATPKFSKSS